MRKVSDKSCRGNQTHILHGKLIFPENRAVWDNAEKYGKARQDTVNNIIRRMRCAYWIPKLEIHTANMQYLLIFHGNNGYSTEPHYYAIRRVPCLSCLIQFL